MTTVVMTATRPDRLEPRKKQLLHYRRWYKNILQDNAWSSHYHYGQWLAVGDILMMAWESNLPYVRSQPTVVVIAPEDLSPGAVNGYSLFDWEALDLHCSGWTVSGIERRFTNVSLGGTP